VGVAQEEGGEAHEETECAHLAGPQHIDPPGAEGRQGEDGPGDEDLSTEHDAGQPPRHCTVGGDGDDGGRSTIRSAVGSSTLPKVVT
jgi:hypothetical protein